MYHFSLSTFGRELGTQDAGRAHPIISLLLIHLASTKASKAELVITSMRTLQFFITSPSSPHPLAGDEEKILGDDFQLALPPIPFPPGPSNDEEKLPFFSAVKTAVTQGRVASSRVGRSYRCHGGVTVVEREREKIPPTPPLQFARGRCGKEGESPPDVKKEEKRKEFPSFIAFSRMRPDPSR